MNIHKKTDKYLQDTYCHLKNNVLVNNQENWNRHPDTCNWARIEKEVLAGMSTIEEELKRRGLPRPVC
ncbi:MAG: hypothetical protein COB32_10625 [Halomonas sp.]|nr:MAG: hypothetical protein COB32_10625 [Halomonas sp.]